MRCYCCNKALSDYEATRKSVTTGNFLDMCNKCYGTISGDVLALERTDLKHDDEDEPDYDDDSNYFTSWNDKPMENE
jgi:hypothetical protein